MRLIILLTVLLGLTSCVTQEQALQIHASQVPPTAHIKTAVIDYIKTTFYDPYSIRDAEISHVVTLGTTGYTAVCVKLNSKNRMGGYVGLTATSFRIKNGVVESSLTGAYGCNGLKYQPFKALEGL